MIINRKVVKKMKNKNKNNLIKWSVILILTLLGALNIARNASLMQVYPISDLNIKPAIKFEVYEGKRGINKYTQITIEGLEIKSEENEKV